MERIAARTILLVEDHDELRIEAKWFLTNFGYAVESVRTAEEALGLFDPLVHDLVITDNGMPRMTGAEMAHIIKLRSPATPVLMFTGLPPADQSCIDSILQKPSPMLALKDAVTKLLSGGLT